MKPFLRKFAIGCASIAMGLIILVVISVAVTMRTSAIDGPPSRAGHTVRVKVSDMHPSPGADYYADVYIYDSDGREVFTWKDPDGQDSIENARKLVSTMSWRDSKTLVFTTAKGDQVELELSGGAK